MESQKLKIGPSFKKRLARFQKDKRSSLCVAVDDEVVGLVAYSDGTRPESAAIVRRLRDNGRRRVVLLSGDSPEVVRNVARAVGIDEAVGGLLPEQKADYVRRMRAAGCVVAMVGDGINDSPALSFADVGIAMKHGAEVTQESADVVLMEDSLWKLVEAVEISRDAIKLIKQNYGIVVVLNTLALGLALPSGLISPSFTALLSNGSAILASVNGVRPLLRRR
jgi:Cu2+-exporting ATPase